MLRAEIEAQYVVEHDTIRSPGKFEGEPVYTPHYWEMALDGTADEVLHDAALDQTVYVFKIDSSDVETWPMLADVEVLRLHERDDGFVIAWAVRR